MTIESEITDYIIAGMSTAYPDIDSDQILVIIADGKAEYGSSRGRTDILSEVLKALVIVASVDPLDRVPFIREFPQREVDIDGENVHQKYTGHEYRDYPEPLGYRATTLKLDFTRTISEE